MRDTPRNHVSTFFSHHLYALNEAWKYITQAPLSSFMTALVISVALVLPATLWTLLLNLETLTLHWDKGTQLTLYLKKDVSEATVNQFAKELREKSGITGVTVISSEEALQEFENQTGISGVLKALNENPLPTVMEVYPSLSLTSVEDIQKLLSELQKRPEVESASVDRAWVKKLHSIIHVGKRMSVVLAILLGLGGILITANTIRMLITHARHHIEVIAIRGGTRAFLRRPFLYVGFFFGFVGSVLAWLILSLALAYVATPVHSVATLYQSNFVLQHLDLTSYFLLFLSGITLNLSTAWMVFSWQH